LPGDLFVGPRLFVEPELPDWLRLLDGPRLLGRPRLVEGLCLSVGPVGLPLFDELDLLDGLRWCVGGEWLDRLRWCVGGEWLDRLP